MLPKFIEDDSDLPALLNTAAKQEKRARQLASDHLGKKSRNVRGPRIQGFFSRTLIVTIVGGEKIVIQFRITPLDVQCFKKARQVFGPVVPEITQLHDQEIEDLGMSVFVMSYMPGNVWHQFNASDIPRSVKIAKSLGTILSHGLVADQSGEVVDTIIIPQLEKFRDSLTEATGSLRPQVESLIAAAPGLRKLPLHMSHYDLNQVNVLIGEDDTVSGLLDWEESSSLPFGMGLHRITDCIVANNFRNTIDIPASSAAAEQAFWDAVLQNAPSVVLDNLEDVQTALRIGTVLFFAEDSNLEDQSGMRYKAGILSYRLPHLRAGEGPFAKEYMPVEGV